jgi:hypothetical protein
MLADGHSTVHYNCIIDEEVTMYLQRHLKSKAIAPSKVERIQVVVGGNHGDVAFQFGASITVDMIDGQIIEFEIILCKVICRKDTAKFIERTILPRLTNGLEIVKLIPLYISMNTYDGKLVCNYNHTHSIGSTPIVNIYVTGDLALQAMALGKELMAGHWCMQCASSKAQFLDNGTMWTMEEMVRLGKEAECKKGQPQLGIKQQPWWPFKPVSNYMVPLLHCEMGIGSQLLDKLHDIINKHIKQYGPTKGLT